MNFIKLRLGRLAHFGRKVQIFVAKGPVFHYVYARWRLNRWLGRGQVQTAILDDQTFFARLNLAEPGLSRVKQAVEAGNYDRARRELTAYFQTRSKPRFFFQPEDIKPTIALIDGDQKAATIRAADEICQNIFAFRGVDPVKFENGVDWTYCPQENIDWTWDLNRHVYFETLGRAYQYSGHEGYVRRFRELLLDWLAKNPVGVNQTNWASVFEVAIRINTWLWAFYYFRLAVAFDPETCLALLKGLLAHGRYLAANLEYHTRNNHLLLQAKALALLGLLLPEFKQAGRWRQQGLKIFYRQIEAQVCADGVHGERATHYHRVIAGELLELLTLLENNDLAIPVQIRQAFGRMVEYELWITKPNGLIPLLNDSALEDTYLRFAAAGGGPAFLKRADLKSVAPPLDEANIWLLGPRRVKEYLELPATPLCLNSRAFPEAGCFIMRAGRGADAAYLAFDCGPFGYKFEPNHGHADALSFELYALGQTMLVDPGIYSAHLGQAWRLFFRGSRAHNTVVVDEQDQSILLDGRRVLRPAQARLHHWLSGNHFDFVDGSHNGYERLPEPITHRRQLFFVKPEYWVIIDLLLGQGDHCFDFYFHLMPGLEPQLDSETGAVRTGHRLKPGLAIVPLASNNLQADIISGATAPIQGWISFFSGQKEPAPTLRYRQQVQAPVEFCTALYPYPAGQNKPITVSPLALKAEMDDLPLASGITGLQIETESYLDYLIVDRSAAGLDKAFAAYKTDAQLIYMRHRKADNKLLKVVARGGAQFLAHGRSLLNLRGETNDFILDYEASESGWAGLEKTVATHFPHEP